VRNSNAFKLVDIYSVTQELIQFGPIKIITVKSGQVRICYEKGAVVVYGEGRYAVNSNTFDVGPIINTQQQNVRFAGHPVLLVPPLETFLGTF
jgi:hypothetical protein